MDNQLKQIDVKRYKSVKDQEILLSSMNVLIGQNGAGKSNFISLFKFLKNIIEGMLNYTSMKIGAENLCFYGTRVSSQIRIHIYFSTGIYYVILESANNGSLFIRNEYCGVVNEDFVNKNEGPPLQGKRIAFDVSESKLAESAQNDKIAEFIYRVLKEWRVYHFHDTGESAGVKKYGSIADNIFLFEDASNLAAFLYVLRHTQPDHYERIIKTVQLVIPFFKDFVLRPNPLNEENIRLEWQDKFSDKIFTAHELSDGSLRFICMATLLLQKELPQLILLDEPELGLHPAAITILAGLLKKASKRSQVIVSTQSVSLVNEFEAEDIIVVEKKEAETTFKRLEPEKLETWLSEYSLGDLWDKNIIGGNP